MYIRPIIIAIIITFVFNFPVAAANQPAVKTIFSNGLVLIVKPEPEASTVAIEIFIRMNVNGEDKATQGLGHLFAGSILGGTKSRSPGKVARLFSEVGGSFHAVWQWDYLEIYGVTVPGMCNEALALLADSVRKPAFYPEIVEYSRSVVLKQAKAFESEPFNAAYAELRKSLYPAGPYRHAFIGDPQAIGRVSREQLEAFHRLCVAPNDIVISIAGKVSFEKVSEQVQKLFSNMPFIQRSEGTQKWDSPAEGKFVVKNVGPATYLMLGFPAAGMASPDYPALAVANVMLGGNKSSMLFRRLREELGIGYQVGSFYPSLRGPSHIVAFVGMDSGRATQQVIDTAKDAILQQVAKLKEGLFTDDDLERAKRYLIGTYAVKHERVRDRAFYLGWYEIIGLGYQYDTEYASKIRAVTREDICRVCERYLGVPIAFSSSSASS
ncbi:MAG: insulinase family protein [Armatimonadetes bacterium]|nr:insulinase family protein [Armatimonadota bacterium]